LIITACVACKINFEIDFCTLKIQFVKLDFSNLIFQNSSTDQQTVTWWHFQSTSKEVIWPKTFLNYMHGLKSAILAIFHRGLGWLRPVSVALKNAL
jgi:hypothetical protein